MGGGAPAEGVGAGVGVALQKRQGKVTAAQSAASSGASIMQAGAGCGSHGAHWRANPSGNETAGGVQIFFKFNFVFLYEIVVDIEVVL